METIEQITEEVVEENKTEIKDTIKESVKKGIKESLTNTYSSVLLKNINKRAQEALAKVVTDDEMEQWCLELKPEIEREFKAAIGAVSLKLGSILFEIMTGKLQEEYQRKQFFNKLFEAE